ncbi:MAG: hypothetical protein AAF447_15100 [Myxococcota bacterium]
MPVCHRTALRSSALAATLLWVGCADTVAPTTDLMLDAGPDEGVPPRTEPARCAGEPIDFDGDGVPLSEDSLIRLPFRASGLFPRVRGRRLIAGHGASLVHFPEACDADDDCRPRLLHVQGGQVSVLDDLLFEPPFPGDVAFHLSRSGVARVEQTAYGAADAATGVPRIDRYALTVSHCGARARVLDLGPLTAAPRVWAGEGVVHLVATTDADGGSLHRIVGLERVETIDAEHVQVVYGRQHVLYTADGRRYLAHYSAEGFEELTSVPVGRDAEQLPLQPLSSFTTARAWYCAEGAGGRRLLEAGTRGIVRAVEVPDGPCFQTQLMADTEGALWASLPDREEDTATLQRLEGEALRLFGAPRFSLSMHVAPDGYYLHATPARRSGGLPVWWARAGERVVEVRAEADPVALVDGTLVTTFEGRPGLEAFWLEGGREVGRALVPGRLYVPSVGMEGEAVLAYDWGPNVGEGRLVRVNRAGELTVLIAGVRAARSVSPRFVSVCLEDGACRLYDAERGALRGDVPAQPEEFMALVGGHRLGTPPGDPLLMVSGGLRGMPTALWRHDPRRDVIEAGPAGLRNLRVLGGTWGFADLYLERDGVGELGVLAGTEFRVEARGARGEVIRDLLSNPAGVRFGGDLDPEKLCLMAWRGACVAFPENMRAGRDLYVDDSGAVHAIVADDESAALFQPDPRR